jgi:tetratricopeptide (TPR) repeat protein
MPARLRWLPVVAMAVAGCAQQPPVPERAPPPPPARTHSDVDRAIEARIALARRHQAAGNPRAAATEWQVLTLLAPDNPEFRRELAASREAAQRLAKERLDAARAAQRSGQSERALEAYVQALAFDPGNDEAARALRELDRQRFARIQQDRAARARNEAAAAPRPPAVADAYDVDQALELLAAGDLAGGLRDLKAWVDANPRQRATRQRIGTAVFDKGRELEAAGARHQALTAYEAAVTLHGEAPAAWTARIAALKKSIADGRAGAR